MKYRDENGVFQDLYLPPTGDTLPIGSEVDYDGTEVPYGWEETTDPESYSTDEVKTNKTWIDGKPIYRKVVEFGSFPNNASKTVATGITNLARIISLEYAWYDSVDGRYYTNLRFDSNSIFCKVAFAVSNNSLFVQALGTDWSVRTSQGVAIIEYTKTTN